MVFFLQLTGDSVTKPQLQKLRVRMMKDPSKFATMDDDGVWQSMMMDYKEDGGSSYLSASQRRRDPLSVVATTLAASAADDGPLPGTVPVPGTQWK